VYIHDDNGTYRSYYSRRFELVTPTFASTFGPTPASGLASSPASSTQTEDAENDLTAEDAERLLTALEKAWGETDRDSYSRDVIEIILEEAGFQIANAPVITRLPKEKEFE